MKSIFIILFYTSVYANEPQTPCVDTINHILGNQSLGTFHSPSEKKTSKIIKSGEKELETATVSIINEYWTKSVPEEIPLDGSFKDYALCLLSSDMEKNEYKQLRDSESYYNAHPENVEGKHFTDLQNKYEPETDINKLYSLDRKNRHSRFLNEINKKYTTKQLKNVVKERFGSRCYVTQFPDPPTVEDPDYDAVMSFKGGASNFNPSILPFKKILRDTKIPMPSEMFIYYGVPDQLEVTYFKNDNTAFLAQGSGGYGDESLYFTYKESKGSLANKYVTINIDTKSCFIDSAYSDRQYFQLEDCSKEINKNLPICTYYMDKFSKFINFLSEKNPLRKIKTSK